jgi:putative aldouronate transport system permease protein
MSSNSQLETNKKVKLKVNTKTNILTAFKRDYQLWLMIIPAIAIVIIFNYVPMYGIQLAFRQFDFSKGLTGGAWAGFEFFQQFITSPQFASLMRNTLLISLSTIIVGFPFPIILALLINQIKWAKGKRTLQTTVYLPHFISIVVMVGILEVLLSPNSGVIGHYLSAWGLKTNILGSTNAFVPLYVFSDIWQHCGWNSIIFLAALAGVDPALYDAAKVDGANRWQIIRNVDLPSLVPTIIILLILNMGGVLSTNFEKIFLMQNTLNLPISEVIATYVYKVGIMSDQFSYASAIGLFNTVINFGMLILVNFIARRTSRISLF